MSTGLSRLRCRAGEERGQLIPGLMLLALFVIGGALILFQAGVASTIRARAQTGADAAALAATRSVEEQIAQLVPANCEWLLPRQVRPAPARAAAASFASMHDAELVSFHYDPLTYSVRVRVLSQQRMDGRFWLPQTRGMRAQARAAARVNFRRIPPVSCDELVLPPPGSIGVDLSTLDRRLIRWVD